MVIENEKDGSAVDAPDASATQGTTRDAVAGKRRVAFEKTEYVYIGVMVFAVLAVVLALGLVFGLKEKDEIVLMTQAPSTLPPSVTSSSAPTGFLDSFFETLPGFTLNNLQNSSSPQWLATAWLEAHPAISEMEKWRMNQLFALATFFYAFEGPNWPSQIKTNWLDFSMDECYWFSSEFGVDQEAAGADNVGMVPDYYPCNEDGEFQLISLNSLDLPSIQARLPPELAFLTSLRAVRLNDNGIGGPLSEVIPEEMSQLSLLEELNLARNSLTAVIPTELGLFTNLRRIYLPGNLLSGPIPSELGLLTSLEVLDLSNNDLTGFIPSEVGALQTQHNLTMLGTTDNNLSL